MFCKKILRINDSYLQYHCFMKYYFTPPFL